MGQVYGRFVYVKNKPKALEVEIENYREEDDKGPPILKTGVE